MANVEGEHFAGLTVALVTPFRDGAVDEAALRKLVDFHVEMRTRIASARSARRANARRSRTTSTNG